MRYTRFLALGSKVIWGINFLFLLYFRILLLWSTILYIFSFFPENNTVKYTGQSTFYLFNWCENWGSGKFSDSFKAKEIFGVRIWTATQILRHHVQECSFVSFPPSILPFLFPSLPSLLPFFFSLLSLPPAPPPFSSSCNISHIYMSDLNKMNAH